MEVNARLRVRLLSLDLQIRDIFLVALEMTEEKLVLLVKVKTVAEIFDLQSANGIGVVQLVFLCV